MGPALMAALGQARILARGPKAAGVVIAAGLPVWARSETEQMDDVLAKLMADGVDGRRVALQEYGMESPEFIAALEAAGATVVRVPVYRWRYPADTRPALTLVDAALNGRVDAITFTSAPAVRNLFMIAAEQQADDDLRRAFNHGLIAACVGPVCAQAARDEGIDVPVEPHGRPAGPAGPGPQRRPGRPAADVHRRRQGAGGAGLGRLRRRRRGRPLGTGAGRARGAGRPPGRGGRPGHPAGADLGLGRRRPPPARSGGGPAPAAPGPVLVGHRGHPLPRLPTGGRPGRQARPPRPSGGCGGRPRRPGRWPPSSRPARGRRPWASSPAGRGPWTRRR